MTLDIEYRDIEFTVEGTFTAGYDAPYATNPDSAAYSDPGTPHSFEIEKVFIPSDVSTLDITDMLNDETLQGIELACIEQCID